MVPKRRATYELHLQGDAVSQGGHPVDSWVPRGLRRDDAARYVGLSPSKFDELVTSGIMPKPQLISGCVVWDRQKLDTAFDNLPDQLEKLNRGRWKVVAV